ncbi:SLBB domain-containing protein [Phascolarctobacterium faecium]|uniref:SLBB domain-containing protein n=1 Tax=Phascolarctobacterium faecium TaxID=33025 RepID=UPI00352035A2
MMERGLRGKVAALGAAVVLCAGGSLLGSSPQDTAAVVPVPAAGISAVQTRGVKVYVSGAVAKPGLYEIPAGSRATAAIAAAGGMTLEANPDKVNLAKLLKDGMQVNVPRLSARQLREQTAPVNAGAAAEAAGANTLVSVKTAAESGRGTAKAGGKVHLNTAAELTALPGVGDITAQRILEYRAAHGFTSIEDVMKVKGIGKAKFSKMQPYLEL